MNRLESLDCELSNICTVPMNVEDSSSSTKWQIFLNLNGTNSTILYISKDSTVIALRHNARERLRFLSEAIRMVDVQMLFDGRIIKNDGATLADVGLFSGSVVNCFVGLQGGMIRHGKPTDDLRIEILEEGRANVNQGSEVLGYQTAKLTNQRDLDECREQNKQLVHELEKYKRELEVLNARLVIMNDSTNSSLREAELTRAEAMRSRDELGRVESSCKAAQAEADRLRSELEANQKEVNRLKDQVENIRFQTEAAIRAKVKNEVRAEAAAREPVSDASKSPPRPTVRAEPKTSAASGPAAASHPPNVMASEEYITKLIDDLKESRSKEQADAEFLDAAARQAKTFQQLKEVRASRLFPDKGLEAAPAGGKVRPAVHFDARVDDDEVLLRLFLELDKDQSGQISISELHDAPLLKKKENKEMRDVLIKALACNFQKFQSALRKLREEDFGPYKDSKEGSIIALSGRLVWRLDDKSQPDKADGPVQGLAARADLLELTKQVRRSGYERLAKALEDITEDELGFERFRTALLGLGEDDFGEFKDPVHGSIMALSRRVDWNRAITAPSGNEIEADQRLRDDLTVLAREARGKGCARLANALEGLSESEMDFMAIKNAARRLPRVSGQRMAWVRSMNLDAALARHLPPGTLDDGLAGLKSTTDDYVFKLALDAFYQDARALFWEAIREVRDTRGSTSAVEANTKFEGFTGNFASLEDFYAGAEETMKLGYPNPDLEKGIMMEHIAHMSAERLFLTPNYQIVTCLLLEYWWAVDPHFKTNPTVQIEKSKHANAKELLKNLRNSRGREVPDARSDDVIFPGEVGDTFYDSIIIFSVSPWDPDKSAELVKLTEELVKKRSDEFLDSDEERLRGARFLSQRQCVQWLAQRNSKLAAVAESYIDSSIEQHKTSRVGHVGVLLPIAKARVLPKCEELKLALIGAAERAQGAPVSVSIDATECKVHEFCQHTSVAVLQKRLEEAPSSELKGIASGEFNISESLEKQLNREELIAVVLDSFVHKELRPNFVSALRSAADSELQAILSAWGVSFDSGMGQSELQKLAADEMKCVSRWKKVEAWVTLFHGRIQGRKKCSVYEIIQKEEKRVAQYKMQRGEVLAAYLYTGPNFVPYNAIYRKFPPEIVTLLEGDAENPANTMSTTLFCISSALVKLGRNTELPEDRKVYRGLGKMLLPQQFWVEHGTPAWKGGVERAIMSTTSDREVALFYSGGKGMVVEISVGRIQVGGDVGWISMVREFPSSITSVLAFR